MQLGIVQLRIRPASPQENGVHERMHLTRERQAIKPVRHTCSAQQRNFEAFRREYNDERPHDALGQRPPASRYTPSPRQYPSRLPVPEYPGHFGVKTITTGGASLASACCTSPTPTPISASALMKPMTASGLSTPTVSYWPHSTNTIA